MENNFTGIKTIQHVPIYFEQDLFFSFYQEKPNARGKKTSKEITREILMDYVGLINGLHKYQICCRACDVITDHWPSITSELFQELDCIFALLVVSADTKGNLIELHNFPYVQDEWNTLYEELSTEYDERAVERWALITNMNILMQDYDAVLSYLKSPAMYGLYFNGYWQETDTQHIQYGEELNHLCFEEDIQGFIKQVETLQQVTVEISGKPIGIEASNIIYTGSCAFLNGALDHCVKKITTDIHTHINYSLRWVGLKQRLQ
jgi:hypothetical protein